MPARHDPYASLRIGNYLRLILSYATSTVAREGQIVVVSWQVFEVTHDPLSLGFIGLAEALPFIAVALYAGHIADRTPRRPVALAGTFGMLLSAIALLLFTTSGMTARGHIWPIYLVIFLSGIARSFTRPAFTALSAELVPREMYANAIAWRSSVWQFSAVLGPAIAGLVYGFAGAVVAYAGVTVLMAVSLVTLWLIAHNARPQVSDQSIGESLMVGIRFLMKQPVLLAAMSLDLFSVLFGGAAALLPIFAHMLGAGPQGLGVLRAAPAIGSFVTSIIVAHRPPMKRTGPALFASVAIFGVSIIAFALSRSFMLSLLLLTISGMADNVSVIIRGTLLQTLTPADLLGRVSSVNQIFIGSSNEIGAFESGVAARLMGTVPSVIFGGCMTLLVVAVTMWRAPRLRKMDVILSRGSE
ncbi:MAG TPA: MFS transporter [Thermoanaerobaculia bacterium]|nr:MFS transporter [Thermoanaerobaculia bacterium]